MADRPEPITAEDDSIECSARSGYHDDGAGMLCTLPEGHDGDHAHYSDFSWPQGSLAVRFCEELGCDTEVDDGIYYRCGGIDDGCGEHFCTAHLTVIGAGHQLCPSCLSTLEPPSRPPAPSTAAPATLSVLPLPDGTYVLVLAGIDYQAYSGSDLHTQLAAANPHGKGIVCAFPVEVVDVLATSFPEPTA